MVGWWLGDRFSPRQRLIPTLPLHNSSRLAICPVGGRFASIRLRIHFSSGLIINHVWRCFLCGQKRDPLGRLDREATQIAVVLPRRVRLSAPVSASNCLQYPWAALESVQPNSRPWSCVFFLPFLHVVRCVMFLNKRAFRLKPFEHDLLALVLGK